jgi:hypothetical protein
MGNELETFPIHIGDDPNHGDIPITSIIPMET